MVKKLNIFVLISLFFQMVILSTMAYSCDYNPNLINVYSNNIFLGEFKDGDTIYIREDLSRYPLEFEYIFKNIEDGCFTSTEDMEMKLFVGGRKVTANSYSPSTDSTYFIDTFSFDILTTSDLAEQFTSEYYILSGVSTITGNFLLNVDSQAPSTIFEVENTEVAYSPNSIVKIKYNSNDDKSGLNSVKISNCYSLDENINVSEKYETFSGEFTLNLTSTKICSIITGDILGNVYTKTLNLVVDSNPPIIFSQNGKDYNRVQTYEGRARRLNLEVHFQDDTFDGTTYDLQNNVKIDFSAIDSTLIQNNVAPVSCQKHNSISDVFICKWENIFINNNTIKETKTVNLPIDITDALSNNIILPLSVEIYMDNIGPEVKEFFVSNYNFMDYKEDEYLISDYLIAKSRSINTISGLNNNSFIFLQFSDETDDKSISLGANFEGISLPSATCGSDGNIRTCIWDLRMGVADYNNDYYAENYNLNYVVSLMDYYGNPTTKIINVSIDNKLPIIIDNEIEVIETEDIEDRIIRSGEIFDLVVYIEDENLVNLDYYHVFADLSKISTISGMNKVQANCNIFDEITYECKFENIVATTGYINNSIKISVYDMAGNLVSSSRNIEILKIADEEKQAFKQDLKYETLNPINRNLLDENDVDSWFEGKIEFNSIYEKSDMQIINFHLISCNESDLDPFVINDYDLYPYETMFNEEDTDSMDATIKINVKSHSNYDDMNKKSMTCTLSILKRDNETLYGPELVNVSLNFGFYAIPRGDILNAHIESLLSDIKKAKILGDEFDAYFEIYKTFDQICSVVNTASTAISTVTGVWTPISIILRGSVYGTSIAESVDGFLYPTTSGISNIVSGLTGKQGPLKLMCDLVTCRNGGWIGAAADWSAASADDDSGFMDYGAAGQTSENAGEGLGYGTLVNMQNKLAGAVCSNELEVKE